MKQFAFRWATTTVALLIATMLPGIHSASVSSLVLAGFILTICNAVIRPILMILSLPLIVMTMGLFYFVVNALVLRFAGALTPGFYVEGLGWAVIGSIVVSAVSGLLNACFSTGPGRIQRTVAGNPELKVVQGRVVD